MAYAPSSYGQESVTYTCTCRPVGKGRDARCKALMSGPQANPRQSHPREEPLAYKAMHTQGHLSHSGAAWCTGQWSGGSLAPCLTTASPSLQVVARPGAPTRAQWPEHSRVADRCCCTLPGGTAWCTSCTSGLSPGIVGIMPWSAAGALPSETSDW